MVSEVEGPLRRLTLAVAIRAVPTGRAPVTWEPFMPSVSPLLPAPVPGAQAGIETAAAPSARARIGRVRVRRAIEAAPSRPRARSRSPDRAARGDPGGTPMTQGGSSYPGRIIPPPTA